MVRSRQFFKWRNEPQNFLLQDPSDFTVKESLSPTAGLGLFSNRLFGTREFLLIYRGDRIARDDAVDNVYTFDSGPPDNVLIDASAREDCIARFINDSDFLYKENCRPVQFRDKDGLVQIAFYTTRIVEAGEELRYNYQCQEAPWKNQPESSADFTGFNLSNVSVDLDSIDITDLNGSQIDNEDLDVEHMIPEAITQKIGNSLIPAMVQEAMTETIGHSSTTCAMVPEAMTKTIGHSSTTCAKVPETMTETISHSSTTCAKVPETMTETIGHSSTTCAKVPETMTETIGHSSTTGTEIDVESSAAPENRTEILATPKTPKENSVATKNYSDNSAPTETEIDVENSAAPENRTEIPATSKTPKKKSAASENNVQKRSDPEDDITTQKEYKEKRNRPRRDKFETCILCRREVCKMRDHLANKHKLDSNPFFKKFLSTYYSTRKTKKCFQCNSCAKRLAFTYGHPESHVLTRIHDRDKVDLFPEQFRVAILEIQQKFSEQPNHKLINDFAAHQEALLEDGECVNTSRFSVTVKTFLTQCMEGTSEFTESAQLAEIVRCFAQERALSKATIVHYLSSLAKFLDYLILHRFREFPNIKEVRWDKVIREIRTPYQKTSLKQKRLVQREKFSKVPTFREVQKLHNKICSELEKDLEQTHLKYRELQVLNFFILSVRLNCRSGPILALTWDDILKIQREGQIETNRHKTGHLYDVIITIQSDQHPWLRRMKDQICKEFKKESILVFASPTNAVEHSVPRYMRDVIKGLFKDLSKETLNKDFHSTSLRKMWDTYVNDNRDKIPGTLRNLHLRQTGHTENTSHSNYIVPGDRNPTLDLYQESLNADMDDS